MIIAFALIDLDYGMPLGLRLLSSSAQSTEYETTTLTLSYFQIITKSKEEAPSMELLTSTERSERSGQRHNPFYSLREGATAYLSFLTSTEPKLRRQANNSTLITEI